MKLIHIAYIIAHRLRILWRRALKISTMGVKVVVLRDDHVLLIRHSYQSSHLYMLPGGGIDRGESPIAAGIREVREETGCELTTVQEHGLFVSTGEGWSNQITVVVGETSDSPVADGTELLEATFFPLDALPDNLSDASRRRIIEVRDGLPPGDYW